MMYSLSSEMVVYFYDNNIDNTRHQSISIWTCLSEYGTLSGEELFFVRNLGANGETMPIVFMCFLYQCLYSAE